MNANRDQDMINKVLGSKGPASKASSRVPADAMSQASRASRASQAVPASETSGKSLLQEHSRESDFSHDKNAPFHIEESIC